MNKNGIDSAVDNAFSTLSDKYDSLIERHLYPAISDNPDYLWLRIKEAIAVNNDLLKEALKSSLSELLSD